MRREETEKLIGNLVITGLINGGYYIGELLEIIPSKPFRANVKVKGVYEYPPLYNHNTKPLAFKNNVKIIQENEIINTGNDIKVLDKEFISYDDSMKKALLKYLESIERTLNRFIENNGNYFTWYINDMEDCIKLKDIVVQKIKELD